jgi:(1->4)-alpha-D-glucan 1-alpha-D-glucosylmutase
VDTNPPIDASSLLPLFEEEARRIALRVPSSTYRIQLQPEFGFDDAARIVPYLAELGVDTLYASPHFRAAPGSTHGYDVIDPTALNEELGGEAAYSRLQQALREHGLGLLIDIVPNHMGIAGGVNPYWQDVLENGRTSPFAGYFDIDWEVVKPEQRDKVLLPILGEFYGVVLENGELQLRFAGGRFTLWYWETPLPIAPLTYGAILRLAESELQAASDLSELAQLEFTSLLASFDRLPPNNATEAEAIEERRREQLLTIRRLDQLVQDEPVVRSAIEAALNQLNGRKGDAASFDELDRVIEAQSYRLAYWRVAAEEINYRRFFAINELAAIRQELPEVFRSTHTLVERLLAERSIDGLRIDHIDGLWNPRDYLVDLQRLAFLARLRNRVEAERWPEIEPVADEWWRNEWGNHEHRDALTSLYVVVEKILQPGEQLPADWPVAGTTGYEFASVTTQLFVDRAGEKSFSEGYIGFTHNDEPLVDTIVDAKHLILREALSSELNVLAAALDRLSEHRRRTRDFTLNSLRFALQETIANFPVYRAYITEEGIVSADDRRAIDTAIRAAIRRNPASDRSVFAFLREMLLGGEENVSDEDERERLRFVMRFQQLTGPVMAKGVEDTAFYRNFRLTALNEVGGAPETFGIDVETFHARIGDISQNTPHTLLASSTHDTKRSEDVRARIVTLSEFPRDWRGAVRRWARLNRPHRTRVGGRSAPSRNDEALFYQSLIGLWPAQPAADFGELANRLVAYLHKAAREAQQETSWMNPNQEYEDALDRFVRRALDRARSGPFLEDFGEFAGEVIRAGAFTSLSMQALKLTCPGVPDLYQGTETLDFSLVDPDNRRPVDFEQLIRRLGAVSVLDLGGVDALLVDPEQNDLKLYLTTALLRLRREHAELFRSGDYRPLVVAGELRNHLIAFERRAEHESLIVVVPRLIRQLLRRHGDAWLAPETWQGTTIALDASARGRSYRNPLAQATAIFDPDSPVPAGDLLAGFAVGCWLAESPED